MLHFQQSFAVNLNEPKTFVFSYTHAITTSHFFELQNFNGT